MRRSLPIVALLSALPLLTGCPRTITVAGSYFPAWLVCIVASLFLSTGCHVLVFKAGMEPWIRPRGIAYPAMVIFFTLLIYLLFFRS